MRVETGSLLAERVCVVTGAGSQRGIGFGIAELFARHGASVAILDLDRQAAEDAAYVIPGSSHLGIGCDVADLPSCETALSRIASELGPIGVLVNSAGIAQPRTLDAISTHDYNQVLDVNLRGTFDMCRTVVPLVTSRGASIINISSVAAQRGGGLFGGAHYCAAKGGVISLTKALARELAPHGIRVNVVCPSMIVTSMHDGLMPAETAEQIRLSVPLGRLGAPSDVAGACLFLASDLASYVTGTELDVNGGSHIH